MVGKSVRAGGGRGDADGLILLIIECEILRRFTTILNALMKKNSSSIFLK